MNELRPEKSAQARRLLAIGAAAATLGLALVGSVAKTYGGIVLLVGWAILTFALHAFGRAGAE